MNITGNALIFRKEYEGKNIYSTTISNKDVNGNYTNMYITVQLPKGTELENKTKINVTKGFISFYRNKSGIAMPKFVIQEFETEQATEDYEENFGESLPF